MKNNKRALAMMTAAFMAITPLAATGMTAFAEAKTGTSTLSITDSDPAEHTYKAYQIITGTQEAGKLKNLAWGPGFKSADLITALNADKTALGLTSAIAPDASVQTVAEALSSITDADAKIKLAKIVQDCVDEDEAIAMNYSASSGTYSAGELADGWYLVLDKTDSLVSGETEEGVRVLSANVLKLVGDTTINAKHSLPTLTKKITDADGSNPVDANTAAIGDVIYYEIKTTVPDVRGYDKYFYVVEDTLSSGLTYNEGTVGVTVSGTGVTEDTDGVDDAVTTGDFYVTHNGTEIKVVFKDAVNYFKNKTVGDPIVITYSATLNDNAVITNAGNPNTAKLEYSRDPNATGSGTNEPGKPDEPGSGSPTGETPESTVKTYTTAIKLHKVDQDTHDLAGAKFQLISTDLNEVKVTSSETFVEDAEGTYYKLKDGSYTKTAPTDSTKTQYENNGATTYSKTKTAGSYTEKAAGTPFCVEAEVDGNGYITFAGLKPGKYTLHESKVPDGYNAAKDVEITITANDPVTGPSNWSYSNAAYNETDAVAEVTIENRQGATLPSTGGIGTKLFYIFGGLLVAGSGVLLITKKRMAKDN